jgi:uncharacterized protein YciI
MRLIWFWVACHRALGRKGVFHMFVVLLTYTQPLAAVDALLPAHSEFLQRMYQTGTFLLSGRKEPRDGGVILANAASAQELGSVLAQDPFHVHSVASYQVIEFLPTMAASALQSLVAA